MTCRVVLFEDEQDIGFLEALLLETKGCVVTIVPSAHIEDLPTIADWSLIDAAVVDLMMPTVGGEEVIDWIRAHHPAVRIILITAKPHIGEELRRRVDVVLSKPFDGGDFQRAVHGGA